MRVVRAIMVAALLLAMTAHTTAARRTLLQHPPASPQTCSSILQAAVYRTYYQAGNTSAYTPFMQAVCSLSTTTLTLPLAGNDKAAFLAAARVLVVDWVDGDEASPDFGTSRAYKVVTDYRTAVCMDLAVSGKVHCSGPDS